MTSPDHVIQHTLDDLDMIAEAIERGDHRLVQTVLSYRRAQLTRYVRGNNDIRATMGRTRQAFRSANAVAEEEPF
jgi:hypothetical protein